MRDLAWWKEQLAEAERILFLTQSVQPKDDLQKEIQDATIKMCNETIATIKKRITEMEGRH